MIQVFPDVTLVPSLLRLVSPTLYYWPYDNDVTPGHATVLGDFTFGGLNAFIVPVGNFTLTGVTSHVGKITAADGTFTNTSGSSQTVYGYFVTDADSGGAPSGNLVMAARFDGAPITVPDGGFINVTPTLALEQLS